MKIKRIPLGPLGTNSYLMLNEEKKECILVDLGGVSGALFSLIEESGCEVKAVLLTHGHFDHIMGVNDFVEKYPVPVYVHEADAPMMRDPGLNMSSYYSPGFSTEEFQTVKDGDVLSVAGFTFAVLHTPGHTPGGCCYYEEEKGVLFSGDTLFEGSVGRTDFPGGSMATLSRSIKNKLFVLPEDVIVYPGHMGETSIQYEKKYNPFVS